MQVIRWDSYARSIIIRNQTTGDPINITWATVFFTVKPKNILNEVDDANAIISKTITSHTDPTEWTTNLTLTTSDTDHPIGDYYFDIQIKRSNGDIKSIEKQNFSILQDVTKRNA